VETTMENLPKRSGGWIRSVILPDPSLADNTADAERLEKALAATVGMPVHIPDIGLLRRLPRLLRSGDGGIDCLGFAVDDRWHLLEVLDPRHPRPPVGLAVDLGTTRIVIDMIDLASGRSLGQRTFDNPQAVIGADVLARIHHCDTEGGLTELQSLVVGALNREITRLAAAAAVVEADIYLIAVAGNTAMTHLFLGLPPHWIIREPYIPVVNRPGVHPARMLGLRANWHARVFTFPNIGSYFGGDLIAGILFTGLHRSRATALMVDVGTNAEVVLGNRNWLVGCAGAAGPALEGGVAKMGATAAPGVIDRVTLDPADGGLRTHTIGDLPPAGICGSGVIDLAAQLYRSKMIDIRGKLQPRVCGARFETVNGLGTLEVVPASAAAGGQRLTISQAELDSLIRSKAAMYTILETLTDSVGVSFQELDRVLVAGTFGAYIDPRAAVTIGMLPDLPLSRYRTVGNSSLGGAIKLLTDSACIQEVAAIQSNVTYLELNVNQAFMNRFSAAKFIPHTDRSRFPSVTGRRSAG
jgi:uncharacterized 2Fe-2S/4Fe-4S cluster protein (DUF4445 family)